MPQSMQERAPRLPFDISQRGGSDKRQPLQSHQLRNLHSRLALSAVGMCSPARLFYAWNALTGVKKTREKFTRRCNRISPKCSSSNLTRNGRRESDTVRCVPPAKHCRNQLRERRSGLITAGAIFISVATVGKCAVIQPARPMPIAMTACPSSRKREPISTSMLRQDRRETRANCHHDATTSPS